MITHLTPRERTLLPLLSTSAGYKEIAHELGLQPGVVKIYAHRLFRKLGARDRIEFMAKEIYSLRQVAYGSAGAD